MLAAGEPQFQADHLIALTDCSVIKIVPLSILRNFVGSSRANRLYGERKVVICELIQASCIRSPIIHLMVFAAINAIGTLKFSEACLNTYLIDTP